MYADTSVRIQNRSDLYADTPPGLPVEGIHDAELVGVEVFANAFGERVGLLFRMGDGTRLMQSAAPGSSRGKLAELLHGLGGTDGTLATAKRVIGRRCLIAVRHGVAKSGKPFAKIERTFPAD